MKAAVYDRFGGPEVIRLADLPLPRPAAGEVLVRVVATTVSTADVRLRSRNVPLGFGLPVRLIFGWSAPRRPVLGTECSGVVADVGAGVTGWSVGDEVVAFVGARLGCHAEFRAVRQDGALIRKPAALSFDEAAAMSFGGATALWFLRDRMALAAGERLLVVGASGAVGSAAVQIGRTLGAIVTGVARAENHDLLRNTGAVEARDYRNWTATDDPHGFDAILDVAGRSDAAGLIRALRPGGRLGLVVADLPAMLRAPFLRPGEGRRVVTGTGPERKEDLLHLAGLAESGAFRPVVGTSVPLERIAEAHLVAESGHKRGSAVVQVTPEPGVGG